MNEPGTERYLPSPDVVTRNIAGEHLLVPVRTGVAQMDYLYTADEVGSVIFSLLDGQRDVAAIGRRVAELFEVDAAQATADVADFLQELEQAGLVRPAGETR
jgi:hypothetical protein